MKEEYYIIIDDQGLAAAIHGADLIDMGGNNE